MKTKLQKKENFNAIKAKLANAKMTVFTSFSRAGSKGLNVSDMKELRKSLRPLDAEYTVEKKTIFDRAIHREIPGSLGVAYMYGDPFATVKAIYQFAKKHAALKMHGGLQGSEFVEASVLAEWAKLPSKEVLIGRLVGMLSYPVRGLAVVLDQIAKQRG